MQRGKAAPVSILVWWAVVSGCTLGPFESARTLPRGAVSVQVAPSVVINELVGDQPFLYHIYADVGVRIGATDHLDVGLRPLNGLGLLADVKYNFLSPESHLAVALQGGFGAATDLDGTATLPLPVRALISYMVRDRFEPFASFGYSFFWYFGRDFEGEPGVQYADRAGYGDGMIQITVGARVVLFRRGRTTGHLGLAYSYWHQVVDDPGDFYSMVDNHFVGVGLGFEIGRRGSESAPAADQVEPIEARPEAPPPPEGVETPWDLPVEDESEEEPR